ncbi:MAG TPA: GNAT family N-acetyltransferase [Candidatus Sulfotelmatobacter sp.]|nr:GNAT family N-acetyltransferase [Candidatus Sulfotelmatobacter sp.]
MRLHLLKEIAEDSKLREQWNALLGRVDQPQVFYTYEWARAVYLAYHETLHPLVFLAYDESEELCGVAALATDAGSKCVSFLCATTADYCDFLTAPENRAQFIAAVFRELRKMGVSQLKLTNLPADSPSAATIRQAASENALHSHVRTAYVCAQVVLEQLERRGPNNPVLPRKKMLRRFLNAMGREQPVRLDHCSSNGAVQAALPEFMRAHVARFLVTGRISNMARPERRAFLAELARLLSGSRSILLTRMISGQRVFAWNYGFQFQGTWFWYQPTFDSDLEKYSPGFCLLAKVIEEAAANPSLRIVDLGLGAEDYKERFANRNRKTLYVSLRSSALAHFAEIIRDYTSSFVRKSRGAEEAVRSVLAFFHRWRRQGWFAGAGAWAPGLMLYREVSYYESGEPQRSEEFEIRRLQLDDLATAVIEFHDDRATLDYLLMAARRLRLNEAEGMVLVDSAGKPLHFAWIKTFSPSHFHEKDEGSQQHVMIVDAWTPVSQRRKHYCTQALKLIAADAKRNGQRAWGCEISNAGWAGALAKAGFHKRYGIRHRPILGTKVLKAGQTANEFPAKEASARV